MTLLWDDVSVGWFFFFCGMMFVWDELSVGWLLCGMICLWDAFQINIS